MCYSLPTLNKRVMISLPGHTLRASEHWQLSARLISLIKQVFIDESRILNRNVKGSDCMTKDKLIEIAFCCKDCRKKLLMYYGGTATLSFKCTRCNRLMTPKNYVEAEILAGVKNGKLFI